MMKNMPYDVRLCLGLKGYGLEVFEMDKNGVFAVFAAVNRLT